MLSCSQIAALKQTLRSKAAEPAASPTSQAGKGAKNPPAERATKSKGQHSFNTLAVHGAGKIKDALGAINMPIYQVACTD